MSKRMCKLVKKEIHIDDLKEYLDYALPPHFVCKKCGRISNKKDYVCKPQRIKKTGQTSE
jgi:hypothetical protein